MNEIENYILSEQFTREPISIVLLNLLLCLFTLTIVSWFYKKHGSTLSGKNYVTSSLPMVGIIVFLLISVIKSSLALSLGLVGALSIVRFRTPIKEPEELAYIFLSIAIGLGYGAGYILLTFISTIIILTYIFIVKRQGSKNKISGEYSLVIDSTDVEISIDSIVSCIEEFTYGLNITRYEKTNTGFTLVINLMKTDSSSIQDMQGEIAKISPSARLTFIEAGVNW